MSDIHIPTWGRDGLTDPLYAPNARRWLELRAQLERGDLPPMPDSWAGRTLEEWHEWVREVAQDSDAPERHWHVYHLDKPSPRSCETCGAPERETRASDLCDLLGHFWDAPWYPHGCQRCRAPKPQEATN